MMSSGNKSVVCVYYNNVITAQDNDQRKYRMNAHYYVIWLTILYRYFITNHV